MFSSKKEKKAAHTLTADRYLIEQIQPQGGITFRGERYIQTGNSFECCIHVYEFPEKVHENWLKDLTDIKDTIVTIDISSRDTYEIKKNINKSLKEQMSRRGNATNWEEAYDAEQRAKEMMQLFHEISQMKEVVKIVDIRIYLSDRKQEKLEEKIASLIKILEANGYRATIFLNETLNEWVAMYQTRIYLSDRKQEKLEEKIASLIKILEANGYRATIFLNETLNEWVAMYQTYTQQQENPYSIYGQPVQSRTLAGGNPFHFSSLEDPYGSYLGYTRCGGNVLFDEFTKTKTRLHYNSAVIGTMGSGKSTLLKKRFRDRAARGDFVRVFDITGEFSMLTKHEGGKIIKFGSENGKSTLLKKRFRDRAARGDFVRVFDITGEFSMLTKHEGGKIIKFGSENARLNPFEILRAGDNETINFQLHMSKLATNYKFLVPSTTEQEIITFSNVVRELYREFNLYPDINGKENQITGLPPNKYPIYTDYLNLLDKKISEISNGNYNETTLEVARQNLITFNNIKNAIEYIIYTFGSIFNGHTTIENILDEQIVCFDISDLKDMKAEIFDMTIFNLMTLCWDNCVTNGQRMNQMEYEGKIEKRDKIKTLILIDEAHRWVNAKKEHALDLITTYLREARKYNGGIILASQSIRDFVPEGSNDSAINKIKTIFELTQYKFIFHQDSNTVDMLNNIFQNSLTLTQIGRIPKLELGDCILCISGDKNYEFHVHITDEEQRLFAGGD